VGASTLLSLDWRGVPPVAWACVGYVVIASTLIAYPLWAWTLQHVPAGRLAVSAQGQPVIASLCSLVFLGERPTWNLFAGGLAVFAGVALAQTSAAGRRTPRAGPISPSESP